MKDKLKGGLADGKPDSQYNKKQLEKGRKIEKEHTDDSAKANEISKDHLEECPDYYTRLEKLEDECKDSKKKKAMTIKKEYKMKLAQVIKNHLSGKETQESKGLFAKISSVLQSRGYKAPFRVAAFDWNFTEEMYKNYSDDEIEYAIADTRYDMLNNIGGHDHYGKVADQNSILHKIRKQRIDKGVYNPKRKHEEYYRMIEEKQNSLNSRQEKDEDLSGF